MTMTVSLPHTFRDGPGNVASGVEVMDNLNALAAASDATETGLAAVVAGLTLSAVQVVGVGGAPAFRTGWSSPDVDAPLRFWKDRSRVYIAGRALTTIRTGVAFQLPADFRPRYKVGQRLPAANGVGPSPDQDAHATVQTDGMVTVLSLADYYYFDGLSFDIAS
jgi:hypothetical protein